MTDPPISGSWTPCGDDPARKHVWAAWTAKEQEFRPEPPLKATRIYYESRTCVLCGHEEFVR